MSRKTRIAVVSGVTIVILAGGTLLGYSALGKHTTTVAQAQTTQPSAANTTHSVQPLSLAQREHTLNATKAESYFAVPVLDSHGRRVTVSVKDHPLVFVSDWDTEVISQLQSQKFENPPVIIVTWPLNKETIQTATTKVERQMNQLGLPEAVYSLVSSQPHQWISGVPDTYVMNSKGQVVEIPGPLPNNEERLWAQVFSNKWSG